MPDKRRPGKGVLAERGLCTTEAPRHGGGPWARSRAEEKPCSSQSSIGERKGLPVRAY